MICTAFYHNVLALHARLRQSTRLLRGEKYPNLMLMISGFSPWLPWLPAGVGYSRPFHAPNSCIVYRNHHAHEGWIVKQFISPLPVYFRYITSLLWRTETGGWLAEKKTRTGNGRLWVYLMASRQGNAFRKTSFLCAKFSHQWILPTIDSPNNGSVLHNICFLSC